MSDSILPAAFSTTGLASGADNLTPPGIAFWSLLLEDLATHGSDLLPQGFWFVFWHRFGNWRMSVKPRLLRATLSPIYRIMFKACEWLCGTSLPYTKVVGRGVCLENLGGMILVPLSIGSDGTVRQNTTMSIPSNRARAARPVTEDHVDIGAKAVIVGDITIGRGAIIGANAVVTKSVPPFAVVVGVPGRVIRHRDPAEIGASPGAPDNAAGMP